MVEGVLRGRRRREVSRTAAAAARYAAMGWPVCLGTYLTGRLSGRRAPAWPAASARQAHPSPDAAGLHGGRACSCDRVGCPAPGAHPASPAWQLQASSDPDVVVTWWRTAPEASVILPTGRVFDVLDLPVVAGMRALGHLDAVGISPGPVSVSAGDRVLFFVRTRGAPANADEYWSCHLDCAPETVGGPLRWHCRDSYVVAPPSRDGSGQQARWLRDPTRPLPDSLRLLDVLSDACEVGY